MIKLKSIYLFTLLFVLFTLPILLSAQESDFGIIPGKSFLWFGHSKDAALDEKAKPLVDIPPLCGTKRRKMGHDLALPFGTGINFYYSKQYYYATDLMLRNDTTGISAVGEASVQNSTSTEMRMTFRPDIWLLPILNVYGIIGYSQSTTRPNFSVPEVTIKDIPNIGDITLDTTVVIEDELTYYAPTYGGGATISAGFKSFFFILDYHYTVNKPKDLDDKLESHNFSAKIGVLLGHNQKMVKGSFWIGSTYINDNHSFTGEVDVKDVLPGLEGLFGEKATYSGTVNAKQYWNLVAGGSVIINKHHLIAAELGYFKREQASITYGFRF